MKTLDKLNIGESGYIRNINIDKNVKSRLLDLGFIKNNKIKCIYSSPSNNPRAYIIMGSVIAIRQEEAKNILIEGEEYGTN